MNLRPGNHGNGKHMPLLFVIASEPEASAAIFGSGARLLHFVRNDAFV